MYDIKIINLDYKSIVPPFFGGPGYDYISIPLIPEEVSITPESEFVAIKSYGRNNPHYQYLGSEDSIEFEIDWCAAFENKNNIIRYCRWVEALSKANSYQSNPPRVMIVWGKDGTLFKDKVYHVVKAPYRLSSFNSSDDFLPMRAIQSVTLKLITGSNLRWDEIIGPLRTTNYGSV